MLQKMASSEHTLERNEVLVRLKCLILCCMVGLLPEPKAGRGHQRDFVL